MVNNFNLERRIQTGVSISESLHLDGILDITQFLFSELKFYLKQENRYFGIINTYVSSIEQSYSDFNKDYDSDELQDKLGEVLYIYRPLILQEFKRLCSFRLSKADCLIVIMKRILDFMEDFDFEHSSESIKINEVISKMYDNIRSPRKSTGVYGLLDSMKKCLTTGACGKRPLHRLSLESRLEEPEVRTKSIEINI